MSETTQRRKPWEDNILKAFDKEPYEWSDWDGEDGILRATHSAEELENRKS